MLLHASGFEEGNRDEVLSVTAKSSSSVVEGITGDGGD